MGAKGASQFLAVAERLRDGSRGLQPSDQAGAAVLRRGATLEPAACVKSPSFVKRRSATPGYLSVQPWAKAHGYRHGLALRGRRGTVWLLKTEMRRWLIGWIGRGQINCALHA